MVRATHEAGGQQAFFVARGVADGAAGAWSAVITSQALAKQMGPVGGRAALALVVGDVDVDNPIEYNFAQVRPALFNTFCTRAQTLAHHSEVLA